MNSYFSSLRCVAVVVAVLGITIGSLLLAQGAFAASPIYVRTAGDDALCNGTADADYSAGIAPACAVKTIQVGINLVDSGGTVYVRPGAYQEDITITKQLTLDGAGSGSDLATNTVIRHGDITNPTASDNGIAVILNASGLPGDPLAMNNVRIETIGRGIGIPDGASVSNVALDNVFVIGNRQQNATENNIGLLVERTASLTNLTISNSAFNRLTYGWYVFNTTTSSTDVFSNVVVDNTTFSENLVKGTYIEKLSDAVFTDVAANDNGDYLAFWNSPWNAGFDINLKFGTFQNITFDNFTALNNGLGSKNGGALMIKARDDGATYGANPATLTSVIIDGAVIASNERGIRIGEPDKNNATPSNVVVRYSRILDNTKTYTGTDGSVYGGLINYTQSSVTGNNNWWGCNYGPGQGGAGCVGTTNGISGTGTVVATDWLVLGLDANPAAMPPLDTSVLTADMTRNQGGASGGYVPDDTPVTFGATLGSVSPDSGYMFQGLTASTFTAGVLEGQAIISTTVDHQTFTRTVDITTRVQNLNTGEWFSTIQAAHDDPDTQNGHVVHAYAYTFTEQVEITKSITLEGDAAGTVVESPAMLTKFFTTTTTTKNYPIIYIHDGANAIIRNLTVDGAGRGAANRRFIGVGYADAGGAVQNVEIKRVREEPLSGSQHGVALYAYNLDGAPRSLTIDGCNIYDYQKNAMALAGDGLTVDVKNNTTIGAGPTTITAQNGIQVGFGAAGVVGPNNQISNVSYTPSNYVASGVLAWQAGQLHVVSNTVTNAQAGFYLQETGGQVEGNTVTASATGVGTNYYYGAIVSDPPTALPSPLEEDDEGGLSAADVRMAAANVIGLLDNTLTGGSDSADSVGVTVYSGYDLNDIDFAGSGNTIAGWGLGVGVEQCTSGCTGSLLTGFELHYNRINSNTAGMTASGATSSLSATCNWWGSATGPTHASNPGGTGDLVSDYVDFSPWSAASAADTCDYAIPARLVFSTQPADGETDVPLPPPPVVQAQDGEGHLSINFTSVVTATLNPPPACLGAMMSGTTSVTATNGVVTFTNLLIDTECEGYTLTVSTEGLNSAYSNLFDIISGLFPVYLPVVNKAN